MSTQWKPEIPATMLNIEVNVFFFFLFPEIVAGFTDPTVVDYNNLFQ